MSLAGPPNTAPPLIGASGIVGPGEGISGESGGGMKGRGGRTNTLSPGTSGPVGTRGLIGPELAGPVYSRLGATMVRPRGPR